MVRKMNGKGQAKRSSVGGRSGRGAKGTLQAAVVVAVATTVPAALGAGSGIQVNNVAAGSATFVQRGAVTTVTTGSQNTIINYNHLSVYAGQTLNFVQPTAASRVLNRIQGPSPTRIDGSLISNGIVYLVNPAGIMFGQGAVINVGRFYAAAGHLSDSDFMAGKDHFTNVQSGVMNVGKIQAGEVHLVGTRVANFGAIVTGPQGIVTMTAGKDVYLGTPDGPASMPHVMVKVSGDTTSKNAGTGVTNAGTISSGTVQLGAGDVYAAGIYAGGEIKALSVEMDGGKNTTIAAGKIDASNMAGKGGDVTITGDKVGLDHAKIDVSGTGGGGTVKVGGDFHGAGDTPRSSETVVSTGTVINANGVGNADGGKVAVWSDGTTKFGGVITAQGGAQGGNGGLVEVSGKQHLAFGGVVNTLAPKGTTGTLLMDPANLTLTLGGVDLSVLGLGVSFGDADVGGDTLDVGLITGLTNVVLQATNNVEIATSVALSTASAGFEVDAGKGIFIDDGVSITTKGGAIVLSAGSQLPGAGGGVLPGDPTGALSIGKNVVLDTTAGGGSADITLRAGGLTVDSTAQFKAGTGTVTFATSDGLRTMGVGTATGQQVVVDGNALGAIQSAGAVVIGDTGQVGNITVQGADLSGLAANVSIVQQAAGAGGVTLDDTGGTALKANGTVTVTAGTGGIAANATNGTAEITTGGQAVSLSSGADIGSTSNRIEMGSGTGAVTASAASTGTVALAGIGDLALVTVNGGTVDVTSGGALTASGTVTGTTVTLNATTGIGTSAASRLDIAATGDVSLTAGGDVFVSSGGSISFAGISAGTHGIDVKTSAGGNIEATGALVGGTVTLEADGGIGTLGAVELTTGGATSLTSHAADAGGDITVSFGAGDVNTSNLTVVMDGTGVHALSVATTGNITVDADFDTGTSGLAFSGGTIEGDGTHTLDGATIALTATGDIGGTTAVDIGTAVATTVNSGGDAHLIYHSALVTSDVTVTAVTGVLTLEGDSISVDSALANSGGTIALKSNTGGITENGGSVTADTVTLESATGVGASGAAVQVSAGTSGTITTHANDAAGDIFVDLGTNIAGSFTFTMDGTGAHAVTISDAGAVTVGANLDAGTNDLFVSAVGVSVSGGVTLSGADVGVFGGTGNIALAGSIDASGGTAWLEANGISQTGGTISAKDLGARATGTTSADGISLTQSNAITGNAALTNATGGGDVALTTSGGVTLDGVTGIGGAANITSSASNGANLTVNAGGGVTVTSAVDAGTGTVSLTATSGGDIAGAGTVSGGSVALDAGGKIGGTTSADALNISVGTGTVSLTTGGNGAAGNIELGVADGFKTSAITTLSLGGTGTKTVELVGAGLVTVDSAVNVGANNLTVDGTSFNETSAGDVTAGVFTINSTGTVGVSGTNSVGTFVAGGTDFTLGSTGSVTVSTGVLEVGMSGTISLAGVLDDTGASPVILQGTSIDQTAGSVSGGTLVANATGAAGPVGVVLGQTGNGLKNVAVASSVAGGAVTVTSTQALTVSAVTTTLTGTVTGVTANGGDISLSGASVALSNVVTTTGTGNVSVNGAGGISGASAVTGHDVALSTATGAIGATGAAVNVDASDGVSLMTTGASIQGDIHVNLTGAVTALSGVTVSTDGMTGGLAGQTVELRGLATLDGTSDFKKDSVIFVGTGGSLTELAGGSVTAANISLVADSITIGGTLHAPTGTIALAPLTVGAPLTVSGLPAGSTAALFQFGNATTGDVTLAGGLDLTGSGANLTIQAGTGVGGGSIIFNTTVTLDANKTLELIGSNGIVALASGDSVKGTGATVVFSGIGGDIGSAGQAFEMNVAHLGDVADGGVSGAGNVYISNDGALSVDGTVIFGAAGNDSFIDASSLTVNQAVHATGGFTLQATNDVVNPGNDLTINNQVASTGGALTLTTGDNLTINGPVHAGTMTMNVGEDGGADGVTGLVLETSGSVSATLLTVNSAGGVLLPNPNLIGTLQITNGNGGIAVRDSQGLVLGSIVQNSAFGVGFSALGTVTQTGALSKGTGGGFDLTVTTFGTSGQAITLDQANDIGAGRITLQTLDGSSNSANGAITYVSSGAVHVALLQSLGTATLTAATTIDQAGGAGVGIETGGLVVSGTRATLNAVNGADSVNTFSSLAANLTGAGVSDVRTRAAGGLVLGPVSFPSGTPTDAVDVADTLTLTNETGAVTSGNVVKAVTLNVTANGGIDLSNTGNAVGTVSLTNAGSGNVHVVNGTDLTVAGVSEAGGGGTSVSAAGNLTFNGTANVGASLSATTTVAGKTFTNNAAITSTGAVAVTADAIALNPGSTVSVTGGTGAVPSVTLTSETGSVQIGLNEADGAGVLGLTGGELATISVGTTVGNVLQIGDSAHTGDIVNGGGAMTVSAPVRLVTTGNVSLSGLTWTYVPGPALGTGDLALEVRHDGTLALGALTLDGAFSENDTAGAGNGGTVTVAGDIETTSHTVTFNDQVVLGGAITIDTTASGSGAAVAFENTVDGPGSLTATVGVGTVLLQTVGGAAPLGVGGLTENGTGLVTLNGSVTTAGGAIAIHGPVGLTSDTTLSTVGNASAGADVTLFSSVAGGSKSLTITAGAGNVSLQGAVTTTGTFESTGNGFANAPAGTVTAGGITVTHTGVVTIDGALDAGGDNVAITGAGIVTGGTGTINGADVGLDGTTGTVQVGAGVTGSALVHSTGSGFANTADVTGGGVTIDHTGFAVNLDAAVDGGTSDVTVKGSAITSDGAGTINGAAITLTSTGAVDLSGAVTGTGDFASTGTTFTNASTATISVANLTVTHTGLVTVHGALKGDEVALHGLGIVTDGTGTIVGADVTLDGTTGTVSVGAAVTGSGLVLSTGVGFTNTASVTGVGVTITHTGGPVLLEAAVDGTTGDVGVTGTSITSNAAGTIHGAAVTLTASGDVSLDGDVSGSGLFTSTGVKFTNNGSITADGISITHTGDVLANGAIDGSGLDVDITGNSFTSTAAGTLKGAAITITSTNGVSLDGQVTGTGLFTSSGTSFLNEGTGSISAVGVTLNHSGDVTINAAVDGTSGDVAVNGANITSDAAGTVHGGAVTLTATANVQLGGNVTGAGLFTSTGVDFKNTGSVTAAGILIDHTGNVTADGALEGLGLDVTIDGATITTTANGTIDGAAVTLTSGGLVSIDGTVTAAGLFKSTGSTFLNEGTGSITADGVTVDHTGDVTFDAAIDGTVGDVLVNGHNVVSDGDGTIHGGVITLTATGNVQLAGNVTGGGLFTSTGVDFTNTGSVTAAGILIDHSGNVLAEGALEGSGLDVDIDGATITTSAAGTIDGAAITLTSGGLVSIDGKVTGTGLFKSTGTSFLNEGTGSISAVGVTIDHTGDVTFHAAIDGTSGDVLVDGNNIRSNSAGTINGGVITLTAVADVSLDGDVTGTGLFTSTGVNFTNNGSITAEGVTVNHTGNVLFNGAIDGQTGDVLVHGVDITSTSAGTIHGAVITLTALGNVQLAGNVTGSGLFTSTGVDFDNTGSITAAGITIDHTGNVTADGALNGLGLDVNVTGLTITTTANGTIEGDNVTLTSAGFVSIDGQITGTGLFKSTGTTFLNEGTGSISAVGVDIDHSGDVTFHAAIDGTTGNVDVTGDNITSDIHGTINGDAITLTAAGDVFLDGDVTGTGLFTSTGVNFTNNGAITVVGVTVTHTGNVLFSGPVNGQSGDVLVHGVNITSDSDGTINGAVITLTATGNVLLNGNVTGSGLFTSTGIDFTNNGTVTAQGVTVNHTGNVLFNGAIDGQTGDVLVDGVNITSTSAGTIHGAVITLTAVGNVQLAGNVTGSGLFTSTGVDFDNTGSITAAGILIDHTGTVTVDGALEGLGLNVDIDGATITTTANGTIDGAAITLTAAGAVSIDGTVTGTGLFKSTGTTFLNEGTGSITADGVTIDHTGDVTFNAAIDGTVGDVLVHGDDITSDVDGTIHGAIITLTAAGNVSLAGNVTGSGLFTSTGIDFTNTGSITAAGITIDHTGNVLADGALEALGLDVVINGSTITTTANGTIDGNAITLTAVNGVSIDGKVTGSGLFKSSGTTFLNEGTGSITAVGVEIDHSGDVTFHAAIDGTSGDVLVDGHNITSNTAGTINGAVITLTATGDVSLDGDVTGTGLFTSTGVNFTNNGSITAEGVTVDHTGNVLFNGAINGQAGDVLVNGVDITSTSAGTINGAVITLTALGNVNLAGNVTGSGLFTSTGIDFTNTGSVTAAGILIDHTGNVLVEGALEGSGLNVDIDGATITTTASGTIDGAAITLTSQGLVSIDGQVTGTGLFKSSGTSFLNEGTGSITAAGVTIDHTGDVTFHAAIDGTSSDVLVNGDNITSDVNGTINGRVITLTAAGNVSLDGNVTGAGMFTSTGVDFTNNGSITAEGVVVNHTGNVLFNGAIDGQAGDVLVDGVDITSTTNGTIHGALITLTASGDVSLAAAVTGSGAFTSTGVGFTNTASITAAGITVTHTGAVNIQGALDAGADDILITGASIASTAPGTMNGNIITLTATSGDVTVGGVVTGTGLFTSTGDAFTNTASITGLGITIDHTGDVNVQAALDGTTDDVLIDGHSIASTVDGTIHGAAITLDADEGVRIGGAVTGSGLFSSTGVIFTNTASITASGITINHTGLVTFSADLTAGAGTGAASVTGAGVDQTAGVVSAGTLLLKGTGTFTLDDANDVGRLAADIVGPLSYTNDADLAVGTIGTTVGISTHDGALHLTLSDGSLAVNQAITTGAGSITFDVPNGSVTDVGLLTTTGGFTSTGINFTNSAPITTTSITLHHSGVASINAALTATHGNIIDDAKTILAADLKASGDIKAPEHIMLAGGARSVTAGGTKGIVLGSSGGIDTAGSGGDLTLKTTLINGNPVIEVGRLGSSTNRLGNVHFFSARLTKLDGDIYASTLIFEDAIPGTPANIPSIATVERNGDLTIDLTGEFAPAQPGVVLPVNAPASLLMAGANFYMERGSKLSVFSNTPGVNGDLTIDTHNHNMVVGDLSALGKINLNAGGTNQTITILNRPAAQVLLPDGSLSTIDHGTDIVAGFQGTGALIFAGNVQVNQFLGATDADHVQIAAVSGSSDLVPVFGQLEFNTNSTNLILTVNSFNALTAGDFQGPGGDVLDIVAHGIGNNPSSSQGSVIPRDVQALAPEQSETISGALLDSLHQIGIYARGLRTDEVVEFLVGRALYDDVPLKLNPTAEDNQVTANRLPYQPVFPTIDAYKRLFLKGEVDAKGNPVLGPDGKQKMEAQDTTIRNILGQTWNLYRAKMQGKETPEGFRAFLETADKSDPRYGQALSYLNQLRDLLAAIKNLGLTTMEFEVSKTTILARVRPSNIRDTDFMNVVTGPSTQNVLTSAR
ncbi:MAG TPA: filamentous hemagglutinin N-terminal domain-containing protein [Phycisphaerae bacterium]|nr:filamentous hemagglutinin N-terminal domain-containing protein [Phycisphaerae bacterium]